MGVALCKWVKQKIYDVKNYWYKNQLNIPFEEFYEFFVSYIDV